MARFIVTVSHTSAITLDLQAHLLLGSLRITNVFRWEMRLTCKAAVIAYVREALILFRVSLLSGEQVK